MRATETETLGEAMVLIKAGLACRHPAMEMAISHALLRRVVAGELPPLVRIYQPSATLAFGRLDRFRAGYHQAVRIARRAGFQPVLRLGGGHAAAYHAGSLICDQVIAEKHTYGRIEERYRSFTAQLCEALRDLGANPSIGELRGEYCPGAHSVKINGSIKVAGVAQRSVKGGALLSTAVVVRDGARVREVLTTVYGALGFHFEPLTAGAVEDGLPGACERKLESALVAGLRNRGAVRTKGLDVETIRLARQLLHRHTIA